MNSRLNQDVVLKHTGYGFWDICLDKDGLVFVDDVRSLENEVIISILTRFNELNIPTYEGFGCRAHELIKAKNTKLNKFKIKKYIQESIENMNRIQSVEDVVMTPTGNHGYKVHVYATSINNNIISAEAEL